MFFEDNYETLQGYIISILHQHNDSYVVKFHITQNNLDKNNSKNITYDPQLTLIINYGQIIGGKLFEGESIEVSGYYQFSYTYGDQFITSNVKRLPLKESHLIVQWITSNEAIKNVGKKTGERLISYYQNDLMKTLNEGDFEKICFETGITPYKVITILLAWKKHAGNIASVTYLTKMNFPYRLANNCLRAWGNKVQDMLKVNPYFLSSFLPFKKLDSFIMNRWDIKANDERRVISFVEDFLLRMYREKGDTLVKGADILRELDKKLGLSLQEIPVSEMSIIKYEKEYYQASGVYLMERYVESYILELLSSDIKRSFDERQHVRYIKSLSFSLTTEQDGAIRCAVNNPISIISGGAGSGKTTIIGGVISQYIQTERNVILLAPTGKAALRMNEATGIKARTIAKFVVDVRRSKGAEKLKNSVIIIDECSMVDLPLIYSLLSYLPIDINLVLVGDPRQLPPVGGGLFFHMLVNQSFIPMVILTQTKRQRKESGIPAVIEEILSYNVPDVPTVKKILSEGCSFHEVDDLETSFSNAAKLYCKLHSLGRDVQIIAATRDGVSKLNNLVQTTLNSISDSDISKLALGDRNKSIFIAGDKVVFNENDYNRGLNNGDIGTVIEVYPNGKLDTLYGKEVIIKMRLRFDERETQPELIDNDVYITSDEFNSGLVSLSYALTCHKAQGSQYTDLIILLDSIRLANNAWIYTALTRATNVGYIIGRRDRFEMAIKKPSSAYKRKVGLNFAQKN
ncbi:TPA: AAA family ATPase [Photobacterium damselae]